MEERGPTSFGEFIDTLTDVAKGAFRESLEGKRIRDGAKIVKTGAYPVSPGGEDWIIATVAIEIANELFTEEAAKAIVAATDSVQGEALEQPAPGPQR